MACRLRRGDTRRNLQLWGSAEKFRERGKNLCVREKVLWDLTKSKFGDILTKAGHVRDRETGYREERLDYTGQ